MLGAGSYHLLGSRPYPSPFLQSFMQVDRILEENKLERHTVGFFLGYLDGRRDCLSLRIAESLTSGQTFSLLDSHPLISSLIDQS
jgi:hypothetical protein